MTAVLAVYGGSFDPVHLGHLALARAALTAGGAARVLFVPAGWQPLKPEGALAPGPVRLAMLAAATADEPRFAVSPLELERTGPSYTLDTLRAVAATEPGSKPVFLCGADALAGLTRWRQPQTLLAEFEIWAAPRAGGPAVAAVTAALAAAGWPAPLLRRIRNLPVTLPELSATAIRQRVRDGLPIAGLVPPAVAALIARHRLYAPPLGQAGDAAGELGQKSNSS